ncbi:hypothetical protein HanIR_Chr09g0406261 [Helianthus annuus]|nr:hypothetical protein HanIR_Chr09g0406261 [Helianthus annuus]KAJ0541573.1 hypothetical protein HanHA89_Chr09g0330011 [Helianthus annuus]KAJ0706647.1 hypothetical protein HanLR1_Chr09g0309441 [Helianthus annuus]
MVWWQLEWMWFWMVGLKRDGFMFYYLDLFLINKWVKLSRVNYTFRPLCLYQIAMCSL